MFIPVYVLCYSNQGWVRLRLCSWLLKTNGSFAIKNRIHWIIKDATHSEYFWSFSDCLVELHHHYYYRSYYCGGCTLMSTADKKKERKTKWNQIKTILTLIWNIIQLRDKNKLFNLDIKVFAKNRKMLTVIFCHPQITLLLNTVEIKCLCPFSTDHWFFKSL